jgi:hypothetical protein
MAAGQFLMAGGGTDFIPAQGCPVAMEQFADGEYFPHNGDSDHFLAAELQVKDGSAVVLLALWRCVYCGTVLVGLGDTSVAVTSSEMTWFEQKNTLIGE